MYRCVLDLLPGFSGGIFPIKRRVSDPTGTFPGHRHYVRAILQHILVHFEHHCVCVDLVEPALDGLVCFDAQRGIAVISCRRSRRRKGRNFFWRCTSSINRRDLANISWVFRGPCGNQLGVLDRSDLDGKVLKSFVSLSPEPSWAQMSARLVTCVFAWPLHFFGKVFLCFMTRECWWHQSWCRNCETYMFGRWCAILAHNLVGPMCAPK